MVAENIITSSVTSVEAFFYALNLWNSLQPFLTCIDLLGIFGYPDIVICLTAFLVGITDVGKGTLWYTVVITKVP